MNDNFYMADLIGSIRKQTTMERYWPLIPIRDALLRCLEQQGVVFRDDVSDAVLDSVRERFGQDVARLLARFLHIYDFNPAKLREIGQEQGTDRYAALADLLRLPGVRLLRAELYWNSGVTLAVLAEKPAEEIRDMVRQYVEREHRAETVPFVKEVNCHREVARMILHLQERAGD